MSLPTFALQQRAEPELLTAEEPARAQAAKPRTVRAGKGGLALGGAPFHHCQTASRAEQVVTLLRRLRNFYCERTKGKSSPGAHLRNWMSTPAVSCGLEGQRGLGCRHARVRDCICWLQRGPRDKLSSRSHSLRVCSSLKWG